MRHAGGNQRSTDAALKGMQWQGSRTPDSMPVNSLAVVYWAGPLKVFPATLAWISLYPALSDKRRTIPARRELLVTRRL